MTDAEIVRTTRDMVHLIWHDHTCPEGSQCRTREVHAHHAMGVMPVLDAIANIAEAKASSLYQAGHDRGLRDGTAKGHKAAMDVLRAFFADRPDTPCRTVWRDGGFPGTRIECVELPMDDLRQVLGDR